MRIVVAVILAFVAYKLTVWAAFLVASPVYGFSIFTPLVFIGIWSALFFPVDYFVTKFQKKH